MQIIYLILIVAGLFVLTDLVLKHINIKNEISRKLIHAITGIGAFSLPYFLDKDAILILCGIFTLFILSTRHLKLLPGIHAVERLTHGELYFPIGIALTAFFFLPENVLAFQFGCLVLGLSDTAADLVGTRYGKHKIPVMKNKSVEGSLAFLITTFVIASILLILPGHISWIEAVGVSILLTGVESILSFGLDNLFLPSLAAITIKLIS